MTTITRNKKLIKEFPFLQPRNIYTDKIAGDYDYSYILGFDDLPKGWQRLFLQMCIDIKKQLLKDNYLHKFRFTEIKEKYNHMRLYHNGCSQKVQRILDKYEHMSQYVCTICGQPAYWETQSYIASFCEQCWKDWARFEESDVINFKADYRILEYSNSGKKYKRISFKREWNRYLKRINYGC